MGTYGGRRNGGGSNRHCRLIEWQLDWVGMVAKYLEKKENGMGTVFKLRY